MFSDTTSYIHVLTITLYSVVSHPGDNSVWQIFRDPLHDTGFRLVNRKMRCYLATSFRTYSRIGDVYTNDTVAHQLRLEMEVVCTTFASARSSILFIIDGANVNDTNLDDARGNFDFLNRILVKGSNILDIGRAALSLNYFRDTYPDFQQHPIGLEEFTANSPSAGRTVLLLNKITLILAAGRIIYLRKCGRKHHQGHLRTVQSIRRGRYTIGTFVLAADLFTRQFRDKSMSIHRTQFVACVVLTTLDDMLRELRITRILTTD